jgi:hypothetical protein
MYGEIAAKKAYSLGLENPDNTLKRKRTRG